MSSKHEEEEAAAAAAASKEPDQARREEPSTPSDATQPAYQGDRADSSLGSSRQNNGVLERRAILHGDKLGSHYVRKQFTHMDQFRRRSDGVLQATERTLAPKSGVGRGAERVKRFLLGQRLTTE